MTDAQTIRVSQMLDQGGLGAFHGKLLVWSLFIVLIDGYECLAAVQRPNNSDDLRERIGTRTRTGDLINVGQAVASLQC